MDAIDHRLLDATQSGLPLDPQPYHALAARLGLDPEDVMARFRRLLAAGAIRRIAAIPNHYALGYRANGMSVWDIDDAAVDALGAVVGALEFVTHCYRRPRHPPDWPYNFFAMVHGRSREEVEGKVAAIAAIVGPDCRSHTILYSTRLLKKTGLRTRRDTPAAAAGDRPGSRMDTAFQPDRPVAAPPHAGGPEPCSA
jgi:DNA-binding Lrp family transcriptional regulator